MGERKSQRSGNQSESGKRKTHPQSVGGADDLVVGDLDVLDVLARLNATDADSVTARAIVVEELGTGRVV